MSQKMQKRQVHMSTGILSNWQVPSNVIYMETELGGCFVIYMEKENSPSEEFQRHTHRVFHMRGNNFSTSWNPPII